MTTGSRPFSAAIDGMPLRSHAGLWLVALALGSVTAFGVWLFNQAIDAVGRVVNDVLVPALGHSAHGASCPSWRWPGSSWP